MKVYLFISKEKKLLKMYEPYTEAMSQKLDITDKLTDADVVLILGAWTMQGAQLRARWAFHTSFVRWAMFLSATAKILG